MSCGQGAWSVNEMCACKNSLQCILEAGQQWTIALGGLKGDKIEVSQLEKRLWFISLLFIFLMMLYLFFSIFGPNDVHHFYVQTFHIALHQNHFWNVVGACTTALLWVPEPPDILQGLISLHYNTLPNTAFKEISDQMIS